MGGPSCRDGVVPVQGKKKENCTCQQLHVLWPCRQIRLPVDLLRPRRLQRGANFQAWRCADCRVCRGPKTVCEPVCMPSACCVPIFCWRASAVSHGRPVRRSHPRCCGACVHARHGMCAHACACIFPEGPAAIIRSCLNAYLFHQTRWTSTHRQQAATVAMTAAQRLPSQQRSGRW